MTTIKAFEKPESIQYLGDGSYYYNYMIDEQPVTDENGEEKTQYEFICVHLRGKAVYEDCVKAVIRNYITESEEFDLINSYNKYALGLSTKESSKDKYVEYLKLLMTIKENVHKDFDSLY